MNLEITPIEAAVGAEAENDIHQSRWLDQAYQAVVINDTTENVESVRIETKYLLDSG